MKLENLKEECPKIPEDIRNMIRKEVEAQVSGNHENMGESQGIQTKDITGNAVKRLNNTDNMKEIDIWTNGENAKKIVEIHKKRYNLGKISVAVLAATMLLGTTAFAGVKLYQWQTQKEGNYGLKAGIVADESQTEGDSVTIPEAIPMLSITAEYLPEGMVPADDDSTKYYYEQTPYQGGISIATIAMDRQLSEDQLPLSDTYVITEEAVDINDKEAIYLEREITGGVSVSFDKKIYVAYPEYWQILEIFVGEDVSKEEALQIADSLNVQPTEEMIPLSEVIQWSDLLTAEEEPFEMQLSASKEEMKNLHAIGDSFVIPMTEVASDDTLIQINDIQAKVTDVQVADDYSLLDAAYVDEDLKTGLDENGKLKQNVIHYMKSGDGIDSLSQEIRTDTVNQKLIYVTTEYTNTGNEELKDVLFFACFVGMKEEDDTYVLYDRAAADGDEETNLTFGDSIGEPGEMDYYDVRGGEEGKNYISSIKPGETVVVHFAKVVNEDELDKMYLSLDTAGAALEITEGALEVGYVDIRR